MLAVWTTALAAAVTVLLPAVGASVLQLTAGREVRTAHRRTTPLASHRDVQTTAAVLYRSPLMLFSDSSQRWGTAQCSEP
jgi:hypothetical protein